MNFLPAVSAAAVKRMKQTIREWQVSRQTSVSLNVLAKRYNATLRGWLNYYGLFYKTALRAVFGHLDRLLVRWVRRKYRTLARHPRRAKCQSIRWSVGNPGCLFIGLTLGESRYGQWEPYEMRISRTVLRAALGATPEAYSLGGEPEAQGKSTPVLRQDLPSIRVASS